MLGIRYPTEVNLVGDAAETLQGAAAPWTSKRTAAGARRSREDVADWWKQLEERAMDDADPINPQRVFWELSPRLPDERHPGVGLGVVGQLVHARPEGAARA